ncbi:hypothetical protein A8U91_01028 [Halomonas elongata]|uniref:Uncharacterized protein n=1 Tax=Halomonas elongata TaxID=2746 RepID=A0A1B8P320_HALEL|nr:hypothetical protein A8U91_01028 [Halomonas elongata]
MAVAIRRDGSGRAHRHRFRCDGWRCPDRPATSRREHAASEGERRSDVHGDLSSSATRAGRALRGLSRSAGGALPARASASRNRSCAWHWPDPPAPGLRGGVGEAADFHLVLGPRAYPGERFDACGTTHRACPGERAFLKGVWVNSNTGFILHPSERLGGQRLSVAGQQAEKWACIRCYLARILGPRLPA